MSIAFQWAAAIVVVAACASPAAAQQPLQQSPITPGFWAWPREKPATETAISEACHDGVAIQFSDGRYFGLRLRNADNTALASPVVDEVGYCQFDRAVQVEHCNLRINKADGTVQVGTMESKFDVSSDRTIKMTVAPKIVDGAPSTTAPFDVFPTRCPDDMVWTNLNGGQPLK